MKKARASLLYFAILFVCIVAFSVPIVISGSRNRDQEIHIENVEILSTGGVVGTPPTSTGAPIVEGSATVFWTPTRSPTPTVTLTLAPSATIVYTATASPTFTPSFTSTPSPTLIPPTATHRSKQSDDATAMSPRLPTDDPPASPPPASTNPPILPPILSTILPLP